MVLLTILRKLKLKEKEMRLLILYTLCPPLRTFRVLY
jgi:hypothetical protein